MRKLEQRGAGRVNYVRALCGLDIMQAEIEEARRFAERKIAEFDRHKTQQDSDRP